MYIICKQCGEMVSFNDFYDGAILEDGQMLVLSCDCGHDIHVSIIAPQDE